MKYIFKEYSSDYNFDVKPLLGDSEDKLNWNFDKKDDNYFRFILLVFLSTLVGFVIYTM